MEELKNHWFIIIIPIIGSIKIHYFTCFCNGQSFIQNKDIYTILKYLSIDYLVIKKGKGEPLQWRNLAVYQVIKINITNNEIN